MMSEEMTSLNFKQGLLVYGFIRMVDQMEQIPDDLIQLCLAFSLILFDKWVVVETNTESLKIDAKENSITSIDGTMYADGELHIKKGQFQKWKIVTSENSQLPVERPQFRAYIGIKDVASKFIICKYKSWVGGAYYRGRWKHNKKWDVGDTITMTLDMTDDLFAIVSFGVNGADQEIVFDNIDIDKEYQMTFAMRKGFTAKLISEWP